MKQKNKPNSSYQNTLSKPPKSFFKRLVQLSKFFKPDESVQQGVQIVNKPHQVSSLSSLNSRSKHEDHLNLPLKHLLTILDNKSCNPSLPEQK